MRLSIAALVVSCLQYSAGPARAGDATTGADFSLSDPPTQPVTPLPRVEAGLVEFLADRFSAHEPIYFLWGPDDPQVKFQVSLKYQIFNDGTPLYRAAPWVTNFYIAYTQQSFWDIGADSGPFFDSTYQPEALYQQDGIDPSWLPGMTRFDLQLGVRHNSNGQSGDESRSFNIAYVRPVFTFGDPGTGRDFFVAVAPRLYGYLGDLSENSDIADYLGYGDLRLIIGWRDGLQLATTARAGNDWDKWTVELSLSYPLRRFFGGSLDMYLYGQYFEGYGESLVEYNERTSSFRLGLALVR